jgi:hypothetical protein
MHFHRAKTHISETARALMMLSAMVFASTANAGIKCWKNHEGVRECGNVVPPEFAQEGHEEKSKSGRTIGAQGRARSAEELAAEKSEQATKTAAEEAARRCGRASPVLGERMRRCARAINLRCNSCVNFLFPY